MNPELFLGPATAAVSAAATLCEAVARDATGPGAETKADRSPVTVADYGAQAVVAHHLRERWPEIPLVGEEHAGALRGKKGDSLRARVVTHVQRILPGLGEANILDAIDAGSHQGGGREPFWTLDPIDGTKGFLRGDQYAVALALIENGRVRLGVLGCPRLPHPSNGTGCLFYAAEGGPTREQDLAGGCEREVRVSDVQDTAQASFCESVESGHTAQGRAAAIASRLGVTTEPYRIDSQAKYAAIARGDATIYLRLPTQSDYEEKIWDHAAGAFLVECAGGTVSDTRGHPLDFALGRTLRNNKGIIATNGEIHDRVVDAVKAVLYPDE
jgi:3'(2'), 5'-bisphosphate nucleotidase